jgi:hypothetical protein
VRYDEQNPVEKNSEIDERTDAAKLLAAQAFWEDRRATERSRYGIWLLIMRLGIRPTVHRAVAIIVRESYRAHAHCGQPVGQR